MGWISESGALERSVKYPLSSSLSGPKEAHIIEMVVIVSSNH